MKHNDIEQLLGFFAEESVRLRMLLSFPRAGNLDIFSAAQEESLKKYPFVKEIAEKSISHEN